MPCDPLPMFRKRAAWDAAQLCVIWLLVYFRQTPVPVLEFHIGVDRLVTQFTIPQQKAKRRLEEREAWNTQLAIRGPAEGCADPLHVDDHRRRRRLA